MKTLLLLIGFTLSLVGSASAATLNSPHFTVDASGTSTASGGRFRLESTAGQADAGTVASYDVSGPAGRFMLHGGFYWPGHLLRIGLQDGLVIVSWQTGVGYSTAPVSAVLEATNELHSDPATTVWTPVLLTPEARSASFPVASAPRFFRMREK